MKTFELSPDEAAELRTAERFVLSRTAGTIGNVMKGTRSILRKNVLSVSGYNKATMPGEHFKVTRTPYDFEMEDRTDPSYWKPMAREETPQRPDRLELKRIRLKSADANNPARHQGLVERAVKWLSRTKKCPIVIPELHSRCEEFPDAMGFVMSCGPAKAASITVECKASRSDFLNDRKKLHRADLENTAKGDFRFYLVGESVVVDVAELPPGWGLLRIKGDRVRVERDATRQARTVNSLREETAFMFAIIRRTMFEGPGFIAGHDAADRPKFVGKAVGTPEQQPDIDDPKIMTDPCNWRYIADLEGDDHWMTACGNDHLFATGGPGENSYKFCPYCGKALADERTAASATEAL